MKEMLSKADRDLVRAVLSSTRKTKHHEWHIDETHVAEVIEAMRICGFAIVPRGVLQALRKALNQVG